MSATQARSRQQRWLLFQGVLLVIAILLTGAIENPEAASLISREVACR